MAALQHQGRGVPLWIDLNDLDLAAGLFFSGLIGPALGCLVLGGVVSLVALARDA